MNWAFSVAGTLAGLVVNYNRQTRNAANASAPVIPPAGKISIIIPAYNEEAHIQQTLTYIQHQNLVQAYPDWVEVIVVDNESTDRTAELANSATTVISAPRGKLNAKNAGASAATGDILVFIDADGMIPPNWLNLLVRHFRNPEVVAVGGSAFEPKDLLYLAVQTQLNTLNAMLVWGLGGGNQAVRKDVFFDMGGFPVDCDQFDRWALREHEENAFCQKLKAYGRVIFDVEASITYSSRSLECIKCEHGEDSKTCVYCKGSPLKSTIMFGSPRG